jgi:hypothetical protein
MSDPVSRIPDLGSHILVLMSRFSNLYFQSFETIFWVKKVLRNLIRDGKIRIRDEKSQIRYPEKNPGSATLVKRTLILSDPDFSPSRIPDPTTAIKK